MSRCACGATGDLLFLNCCRDCFNEQRRKNRPASELTRGREWQAKNWYGISLEEREGMAVAQNHCCAICKTSEDQSAFGLARLHVDHCHTCLFVRGLVCNTCNGRIQRHEVGGNVPADLVAVLDNYIDEKCWLRCRVRRDVGLRARKTRRPNKPRSVMASAARR